MGRENQTPSIALTSSPEKCGEGPKRSRVPSEAPGARGWDSEALSPTWAAELEGTGVPLGCAHAPGSQCGFPTPGRVAAQRPAALTPTRPGQGLRGARGPRAPGVQRAPRIRVPAAGPPSPRLRAHAPAHGGARPGHPGHSGLPSLRVAGGGGGGGSGRGFPESVSPLPSKLPGTQVLGSGAGWTIAQSPQSVPRPRHPEATRAVTSAREASELRPPGLPAPSSGGRSAGPFLRARGSSEGGREGGSWAGGWPECTE